MMSKRSHVPYHFEREISNSKSENPFKAENKEVQTQTGKRPPPNKQNHTWTYKPNSFSAYLDLDLDSLTHSLPLVVTQTEHTDK